MLGVRKPFSQGNHDANDIMSRKVVLKYLRSKGYNATENADKYGIDLCINGKPIIELERRCPFQHKKFPYSTVHIPSRKSKFIESGCIYIVINETYTYGLSCSSKTIKRYSQIEIPNKSMLSGEYFYDVPLSHFILLKLVS